MDVILSFMIVNVFLLLGMLLREVVPVFKKLFIPASILGGILLLLCGPQVLGLFDITADIKGYPNFLIIIILTCTVFGNRVDKSRIRSYADFTVVNATIYGIQLFCGVGLGYLLSRIWTTLPPNWGIVSVFTFWGGHGAGASSAKIFTDAGYEDYLGIAMVCATVGLIAAMTIGMMIVNWGIRKGHCKFTSTPEKLTPDEYGGILPQEKREPIGLCRTSSAGINSLALQMALIFACIMVGWGIKELGAAFIHPVFLQIDEIVNGIIGALIIWPIMRKAKVDDLVDKKTVNNISGFCMEYLIVAAVGTLRLETMATFIAPITIYCIVMIAIMIVIAVPLGYKFHRDEWFEKMITNYGQCTGSTPTGLALLRCVDPKNESCAADATGVSAAVFMPVYVTMIAFGPVIALSGGGTLKLMGIGIVLTAVGLILGNVFFKAKDHNNLLGK